MFPLMCNCVQSVNQATKNLLVIVAHFSATVTGPVSFNHAIDNLVPV